jgi:hypothetical protein
MSKKLGKTPSLEGAFHVAIATCWFGLFEKA